MVVDVGVYILAGVFLLFVLWREWQHDRERKDLYSRLMAKDLTDYTISEKQKMRPPPSDSRGANFVRAGLQKHYEHKKTVNQDNIDAI
jgi:hypothetical protein